jgi:hypothetical protein
MFWKNRLVIEAGTFIGVQNIFVVFYFNTKIKREFFIKIPQFYVI